MANGIGDALINIGAGLMDRHTRELEAKRLRDARLEERKYQEDMAFKMNEANNAARAALEDKKAANARLKELNKPPTVTSVSGGYLMSWRNPETGALLTDFTRTQENKPTTPRTQAVLGNDGSYHVIDLGKTGPTGVMGQPKSGARTDEDILALEEEKRRRSKLLDAQLAKKALDSMSNVEVAAKLGVRPRDIKPEQAAEYITSQRKKFDGIIEELSSSKRSTSKSSGSWLVNAFSGLLGTASAPVDELAKRAAVGEPVDMPPGTRMDIVPIGEENFNKMVDDILKEAKSSGTPISRASAEQMAREELGLK